MANVSHSSLSGSSLHVAGPLTRVRVASTANLTLASGAENGDVIDGVTLATGDRILLKDQTSGAENGIRVVAASGAPTRATDFDTAADMQRGLPIFVEEGTANAETVWVHTTSAAITVNTTALTFAGPLGAGGGGGGALTVANDTGSPMTKGTVAVFAYGSVGGVLTAEPYQGNGSWDTAFRGVLAEDIADGATGTLVTNGEVTGLDTSAFTAGNPLYSDASAQLTETNSPYYEVIAECVVSDATAGVVRVDPHYEAVPPHGHYADQVGGLVNINALTADASPDGAADYVMTYDASASTNKKVLLDDLPAVGTLDINGLTEDTTPAGTDFLPSYDVSATANKKVKPQNLPAFTGDSGSGGVRGQVPAPAGGDAAAGKYLKADGTWDVPSGTGAVASDPLWDAKGDLAAGTGANTASKLTVGANDTILMADSAQSTGLKWVGSQTPSTQAFGDAAAEGTADTYARGDHKHAMPAAPSAGLYSAYLCYADEKTGGTNGGTFTSGAWRTRDLNTERDDTGGHGSVASNQITLAAGTYYLRASAPAFFVDGHQARWQNVTDATTTLVGTSEISGRATTASSSRSYVIGRFTIAATKTFELQHRCTTTQATNGLGVTCNFGVNETYSVVELLKEA